ncbi:MAG: (2Fe-2S)-binding protein [Salinarimonadaceae bacterium]|nr:MAG: (2Fe-2S)-binding protein [Salinarimonadaceae bacterium]
MGQERQESDGAARQVGFVFDGTHYRGRDNQPLAIALLAAGQRHLRDEPVRGEPRGAFCMMGICQDCVVIFEGRKVEACRLRIFEGLVAERAP